MARILIRCPTLGKAVPTGLTTDAIKFHSLDFKLTLRCPACNNDHDWSRADAWIEGTK
jgi:hypothetical protein